MDEPKISKGEQTRREILAAAKRLHLSQGFTATSMRQIAREVGITPAAIYNHYATKDQLFTALLQSEAPFELFGLFDRIEADTTENTVRQMLRTVLASLPDHQDYFQLALIDAQERSGAALASLLPEVLPQALAWHQRLVAQDAARRDGARLRQIPFLVFARTLLSLLAGFMLTERVATPDRLPQVADIDWAEALADVVLHGVLELPAEDREGGAAA